MNGIQESGWNSVLYFLALGVGSLAMVLSVLRGYYRERQRLGRDPATAEPDHEIRTDPVQALVSGELAALACKAVCLSLLWGAASLSAFVLGIPALAAAYHLHNADAFARRQEYAQASGEYRRAMQIDRIASEINLGYDQALALRNAHGDTVLGNAQDRVQEHPDEAAAHNDLAGALMTHQELDRAIQEYRRALALRPDYALVHNNLALALQMRRQPADALAEFRAALALEPGNPAFHYNLARAYLEGRDVPAALAEFRRSLSVRPNFVPSYLPLADLLHRSGHPADAEATLERLLREMQGDPRHAHLAAKVRLTLHDWQTGKPETPVPAFDTPEN